MEIVKDMILYQVATDRNYKVGDKLVFDNRNENGQFNRVYNTIFKIENKRISDIMYESASRKIKKFKNKEQIYEIAHKLEAYDVILKELALESIREKYFTDYPSRLHCMYLSIDKEIALNNVEKMANNREKNGKRFQVVAVKLNGKIFKAGKVYISREGQSLKYYLDKAKEYWQQKDLTNQDVKEILFEGQAEIVEILKEVIKD